MGLWSEGIEPRLVAWVTPSGAGTPDFESLRQRLAERLPPSHRPSYIGVLEALPKRANGKLDRAALPVPPTNRAAGNSAPVGARFSCDPASVPALSQLKRAPTMSIEMQAAAIPAGSAQAVLTEIWSELLGIPAPRSDDDFFALGGHSLLAMRLVARLKDRLQIDLPLIAIFEHPTISGLAPIVASLRPSDAVGPIRRRRRGPKPGGTP